MTVQEFVNRLNKLIEKNPHFNDLEIHFADLEMLFKLLMLY